MPSRLTSRKFSNPIAGMICLGLAAAPAWAQAPVIALSDLVNQGSDYAQQELRGRGYVFIHADQRGSKLWQYWWQNRDGICARVAHVDGRASSIVGVNQTDCNQYGHTQQQAQAPAQTQDSGGMSTGAKVAIGAAALVGVAALVHRSHERDEQKHASEQQVAEYERGYRDGLYHQPYHDYNRSQSYVDGYNAGQQKRDAETQYRSPYGYHSGQAAYMPVNDLVGAKAASADASLRQRGFGMKGGYKSDNRTYSTWWNPATRQCTQFVVADGRVLSVQPLSEGNCL